MRVSTRSATRSAEPPPQSSMAEVTGPVRQIVRCCAICPAGIISTAAYDVNVPFMQLEQHGWDIHVV